MARTRRETENDEVPDGENLTAEQFDIASVEMLQNYMNIGLRCLAQQCTDSQAMGGNRAGEKDQGWTG